MREGIVGRAQFLAARLLPPLAVGLLLAALGPFGTFESLGFGRRALFWCGAVGLNWVIGELAMRTVPATLPGRWTRHRLVAPLASSLVVSLPATAVVAGLSALLSLGMPALPRLYGEVLLVTAAISLALYRPGQASPGAEREPQPERAPSPSPGPEPDLFARRIPASLEGRLLCLEMEDHYLRIHTDRGSALVLCRMEDAARELDGRGLRVHRSWWVASDALAGSERDGQRLLLRLDNGLRVPVGKTYRAALKGAGWLQGLAPAGETSTPSRR
ncbi:transcriptional regulator, LytTR family [Tistlia consotensis]|uniref:Transcriptional regulator, LytTR family n=1 Tax=Tistlia consotensis USBA 355 TaxID=560819 RepID=A0A1Y6CE13_9PROT|nr:LytTR family DNA-binding domain-containing protein [Tistlia consotensis]SMF51418.1 transcriptional regulator, LytTR family [Tistlia consotensis USBA 355]SNR84350.1 transcriptional regulator, LytTR family [Tistlia consotensis]